MESTVKYWIPIYNIMECTCNIVLARPKYVKAIRSKKTDKQDTKWIADIFLESLILSTTKKYLPQLNLVISVPGIQSFAAIGIISEIEADMSVFPTSKHLCSWTGLTPQNNESARKKKTGRISSAWAYIKPLLIQCALCAIRAKQFPEVRNRYLARKSVVATKNPLLPLPAC